MVDSQINFMLMFLVKNNIEYMLDMNNGGTYAFK